MNYIGLGDVAGKVQYSSKVTRFEVLSLLLLNVKFHFKGCLPCTNQFLSYYEPKTYISLLHAKYTY